MLKKGVSPDFMKLIDCKQCSYKSFFSQISNINNYCLTKYAQNIWEI